MKLARIIIPVLVLVLSAFAGLMLGLHQEPQAVDAATSTYSFNTAMITTTTYSAGPYVGNLDEMDLFVTVDISGTGNCTFTVQTSYDASNWTTLDNLTGTALANKEDYKFSMSADGTDYMHIDDMAGLYVRIKMETNQTVTPTIKGIGK